MHLYTERDQPVFGQHFYLNFKKFENNDAIFVVPFTTYSKY